MDSDQDYGDFTFNFSHINPTASAEIMNATSVEHIKYLYLFGYSISCTLGLTLNFLVIIAGCCRYRRLSRPDTCVWVLGLTFTHLITAAFLTLQFFYAWHDFDWQGGTIMCKLSSYIFYSSLFSTGIILSLESISSAFQICQCFKNSNGPLFMVLSAWTLSAILCIPSLYSRELREKNRRMECIDDYDLNKRLMTEDGKKKLTIVLIFRFFLGILIPLLIMGISCCLARRNRNTDEGVKLKIFCWVKVTYFICWTPLLFLHLFQLTNKENSDLFSYGLPIATVLATFHCCINPVIYFLVSCDLKMSWMDSEAHRHTLYSPPFTCSYNSPAGSNQSPSLPVPFHSNPESSH